jgi:multidrug resistance efflux pump
MDKPDKLPRIPSPPGTAFREFRIRFLPALTFAAVLGATAFTWQDYVSPSNFVGEVEAVRSIITSTQPGRLAELTVNHLQQVNAGDVLARILPADPKLVEAQVSLTRARLIFLREGVDARVRQQNNRINFTQLKLDWLDQRVELAALKARLSQLEAELIRARRAYEGVGLTLNSPSNNNVAFGSLAELQLAEADYNSALAETTERQRLVSEIESTMTQLTPDEVKLNEEIPAALRSAVAVQEQELRLLEAQLAPITLTAPIAGVVAVIHRRNGENVLAGEPIITLSALRSDRVVAFIRQPLNFEPTTNTVIEVRSRSLARTVGQGRVLAVGSQMELILPELLAARATPNALEYGLPILISLPPEITAKPGEIVDLLPLEE